MYTLPLLSSSYLPPIAYFARLYGAEQALIEGYDHYVKQTYRNRCTIADANGRLTLTIPVEKTADKTAMKDIRLSEHGNWRHVHRHAFISAYRHSPFFEYYADEFLSFYEKRYTFLYDFNMELMQWLVEQIDLSVHLMPTQAYLLPRELEAGMLDCRAFSLLEASTAVPYYQVFHTKHGFLPHLSTVDLLFNMGAESVLILRQQKMTL